MRDANQIQVLARRVSWLDAHRRTLALTITTLVLPLLLLYGHAGLADYITAEWPRLSVLVIFFVASVTMWLVTETTLAWLTAVWETDCVQLTIQHRVPPARLLRRRRK